VILVPNVVQEKQVLLFRAALTRLAELGDPINKLLQVDIGEDEITLRLRAPDANPWRHKVTGNRWRC